MNGPNAEDVITITKLVSWISLPVLGVLGYYLKKILSSIESIPTIETKLTVFEKQLTSTEVIVKEWGETRFKIDSMMAEMRFLREHIEHVSVLKRDQTSIWKRIDELREKIAVMDEKSHTLQTEITVLKSKNA